MLDFILDVLMETKTMMEKTIFLIIALFVALIYAKNVERTTELELSSIHFFKSNFN